MYLQSENIEKGKSQNLNIESQTVTCSEYSREKVFA